MSLLPAVLAGLAAAVAVGVPADRGRLGTVTERAAPTDRHALTERPGRPERSDRFAGLPGGLPRLVATLLSGGTAPGQAGPGRVLRAAAMVAPGLAGAVALLLAGPSLGVVVAAVVVALGGAVRRRARTSALRAERRGATEACAVLAAELRAGRTPAQALEASAAVAVGPFRARLLAGAGTARLGGDTSVALGQAAPGPPTGVPEAASGLAACWAVCAGTGGGLAAAVERLEQGLRSAAEARRAVEAELAGPRATAGLLAVLPLAGIALAAALGARPGHVLLHTTVGGVCLVLGGALDLAGLAWSRRIARSAGAD